MERDTARGIAHRAPLHEGLDAKPPAAWYQAFVPPGFWMLIAWIVIGAAWLVVHVFLVIAAIRGGALLPRLRWAALFPPAAPIVGWFVGAQPASIAWCVLGLIYLVLRLMRL